MTFQIRPVGMTARRMMRTGVVAALRRANLAIGTVPVSVQSPGDWAFAQTTLPAIAVRSGAESKTSTVQAGLPQFNTTVSVQVKAVVQATTAEAAQQLIELLWYRIENAILLDYALVGASNTIQNVTSSMDITADGQTHIAGIAGEFDFEVFEAFDPMAPLPADIDTQAWPPTGEALQNLTDMQLHVDLTNVADPTGTYPDGPFAAYAQSAPRAGGPDGRDEGVVDVPLS